MRYDFDWDIKKAKSNLLKHEISFERATNIFRDPIVVSHTFAEVSEAVNKIRIISARKATKTEMNQYEKGI